MFWLLRPPVIRWLAAGALFAAAAVMDLADQSTADYPFASSSITAGEALASAVEWRDVPRGLLPEAGDVSGFAARHIDAGEPITANAVRSTRGIPPGWWSVRVALPEQAAVGDAVRLLSAEGDLDVDGIVDVPATTGTFATINPGSVAVPAKDAPAVATAAALDRLIVLVGT